jgi:hypothetical protein
MKHLLRLFRITLLAGLFATVALSASSVTRAYADDVDGTMASCPTCRPGNCEGCIPPPPPSIATHGQIGAHENARSYILALGDYTFKGDTQIV